MGSRRNVDRLSSMPDEVISRILSLMPTEYAVRTCVLSKSWIHSWKSVTKLDIDCHHTFHDMHCLDKFVNGVLEPREASQIKVFRLHCSEIWVRPIFIKKWIDKATKLNVSEIEVRTFVIDLPRSFICKTLTKLTLVSTNYESVWNITSIDLPLLKTLDIKVLTTSNFNNVCKLIPGCPLLETLSIEVALHYSNEVYSFNIPTLKRLKLHFGKGVRIKKVVLNVPNLEELFVAGCLCSPIVMENFPPLVSVTLSCLFEPGLDQPWVELLTGISGAKSITMGLVNEHPFKSYLPKYLNLKHLEFRHVYGDPMNWLLINEIIENSDELEHLCIEERLKGPYKVEAEESCWIEPQIVPTCVLINLRAIKFVNCKGWKSDLQFMAYMLGNAQVLKTLTIIWDRIPLEEQLRLKAELLKLPRASRYCEIHLISSASRYTST